MERISTSILVLVALLINCQLSCSMKRPAKFDSRIMGSGNDGLFRDIKSDIIKKSTNGFKLKDAHLAHVFPWAAIDECVDVYWHNSKDLNTLVREIFEVDIEAVAPEAFERKLSSPTEFVADSSNIVKHSAYLGTKLVQENTDMENEALNSCRPSSSSATNHHNVVTCKTLLFNAPANLRFGDGKTNTDISDRLDFMGLKNGFSVPKTGVPKAPKVTRGKRTKKETRLSAIYEKCYSEIEQWCGSVKSKTVHYCESGNNRWGIRSSSSQYEYVY